MTSSRYSSRVIHIVESGTKIIDDKGTAVVTDENAVGRRGALFVTRAQYDALKGKARRDDGT